MIYITTLLGLLWFYLILINDVKSDYEDWRDNIAINHNRQALSRMLYLLPSGFLLCIPFNGLPWWEITLQGVVVTGLIGSMYWEFFDGMYNKIRGFPWRFNGSVDRDDAKLDRLLYKLNDKQQFLLKWGLIVLFLSLWIYIKVKNL